MQGALVISKVGRSVKSDTIPTTDNIRNSNEEVNGKFSFAAENKGEQPFYGMPINELHSDPELAIKKRNSLNTAGNNSSNPNSKLGSVRDSSASIVSIP